MNALSFLLAAFKRCRRAALPLAAAWLCTACALNPPVKVDFTEQAAPVRPVVETRQPPAPAVTGSLYHSSRYRPIFEDWRARMVGDTVTIQIVENVSASQKSTSTVDRSSNTEAKVGAFPFLKASSLGRLGLDASSANVFSGKGGTESANTFSGSITATVVEVLPNGHLVLTGDKQIGVNHNVDVLRFSGTVDPRAIQSGSVVSSTQVANARIESRGRGQQTEAQTMGWLSRFFLTVLPF